MQERESREESLQVFAKKQGLRLKKLGLLNRALTHSSYLNEKDSDSGDNQRLEFLGDSIVGFIVSEYLFLHYGENFKEGQMSSIKSELVSQDSLASIAARLDLGSLLRMGHGERKSGGVKRNSNLADAFEALTAAIYLECGLLAIRRFLLRCFDPQLKNLSGRQISRNFKSRLQELVQQKFAVLPLYEPVSSSGPPHKPIYIVRVIIDGEEYAHGRGNSYKRAEQKAAQLALRKLSRKIAANPRGVERR